MITRATLSSVNQGLPKYRSMLAGNTAYMPSGYFSIASATPTGTTTVTFSSIPQIYSTLIIKSMCRDAYSGGVIAGTPIFLQVNGDSSSNYTYKGLYSEGSTLLGYGTSTTNNYITLDNGCALGSCSAGVYGVSEIQIQDYAATDKFKPVRANFGVNNNSLTANFEVGFVAGAWKSTSAINSVTISTGYNFVAGTTISLYGLV